MKREEIVKKLLKESEEFRRMKERHEELDKEIKKLEKHFPMTLDLQMEIEKKKKEKLLLKDKMEEMIRRYEKA